MDFPFSNGCYDLKKIQNGVMQLGGKIILLSSPIYLSFVNIIIIFSTIHNTKYKCLFFSIICLNIIRI